MKKILQYFDGRRLIIFGTVMIVFATLLYSVALRIVDSKIDKINEGLEGSWENMNLLKSQDIMGYQAGTTIQIINLLESSKSKDVIDSLLKDINMSRISQIQQIYGHKYTPASRKNLKKKSKPELIKLLKDEHVIMPSKNLLNKWKNLSKRQLIKKLCKNDREIFDPSFLASMNISKGEFEKIIINLAKEWVANTNYYIHQKIKLNTKKNWIIVIANFFQIMGLILTLRGSISENKETDNNLLEIKRALKI